jgi:hypothetical protein
LLAIKGIQQSFSFFSQLELIPLLLVKGKPLWNGQPQTDSEMRFKSALTNTSGRWRQSYIAGEWKHSRLLKRYLKRRLSESSLLPKEMSLLQITLSLFRIRLRGTPRTFL